MLIAGGAMIARGASVPLPSLGESPMLWEYKPSITTSHPFIEKRSAANTAAEMKWYDGKVFNIYIHDKVFKEIEIMEIIDNTWVVFVIVQTGVTNYAPIYNINRIEEVNI